MKKKIIIISLIFTISALTINAQYAWHQKANFGGGNREGTACFALGSKGYFACGYNGSSTFKDLWEYDPVSDSWTAKTSMPMTLRRYGISFGIGTKGYVGSGQTTSGFLVDFWEYDQATDSWTQKANIPGQATYGAIGFSIDMKGYFGTGNYGSASGPYRDDFYEYDPATNVWTQKATFPGGVRYGAYGMGSATKGYIGFGLDQSVGTTLFNDWWEYNPVNDTWTARANYPGAARTYLGGFKINGNLFVGTGAAWSPYNDFYQFDPIANSWSPIANFPGNARYLSSYFSIGNIGYVGIGYDFNGDLDDFYEYAPSGLAPIVSLQSSDTNWCEKRCIDFFDLSTNNPTSWQWYFPGATPDTSTMQNPTGICYNAYGHFDVKLVACNNIGCDSIEFISFINEFQSPPAPTITQSNDTIFSSAAYSYAWYEMSNINLVLSTNSYYVTSQPGSYFVLIRDSLGCETPSTILVIQSTNELVINNNIFSIMPNPSNGLFSLELKGSSNDKFEYIIYDALGHAIENKFLEFSNSKIDFQIDAKGIYFLEIRYKNKVARTKILVN